MTCPPDDVAPADERPASSPTTEASRRQGYWLEQLLGESGIVVGLVDLDGRVHEIAPHSAVRPFDELGNLLHPDDLGGALRALAAANSSDPGEAATTACRVRGDRDRWDEGAITFTHLEGHDDLLSFAFEPGASHPRPGLGRNRQLGAASDAVRLRSDPLTGLPGRTELLQHLGELFEEAGDNAQVLVAVIDLDHFRLLNSSLGPDQADTILLRTADRLREIARPDAAVARLGADEFGIAFGGIHDLASAGRLTRRLLQTLGAPIAVGAEEVSVTVSVGLVVIDEPGASPASVLRDADAAQWQARRRGGGRYEIYMPGPAASRAPRSGIVGRLHRSIDRAELSLVYQPVAELATGRFVDAEALIRWDHPEHGLLMPDEFIPQAEQTGFIVDLGTWAIEQVCLEIARWTKLAQANDPGGPLPRASVNVSTLQITRPGFTAAIRDAIAAADLEPEQLGLEITESALMTDLEGSIETLWQLRGDGIRILADDFGTGYSSLAYLSRLPLDALKVDRAFVTELDRGTASAVLVRGVIELARSIGVLVVAEGVETQDQLTALQTIECDLAQGYLLAYPSPADEVGALFGTTPPALRDRRAS